MAVGPSLRGTFATFVPSWLGNVPGLRNLFSIAWAWACQGDMLREWVLEGQYANYPGVGTTTALPYIGATRGLVQGPTEPNASFAVRCRNWLSAVAEMGNSEGLVTQVQAYLVGQGSLGAGVYPVVIFIDRHGNTTTANANQTISYGSVSWDWDEVGGWVDETGYHPPSEVDGYWSDGWLIIQDPYTHYTGFSDPNWLAAWNSGDQTFDSLVPQAIVSQLLGIIDTWKGDHVYIRCIVWTANPTSFLATPNGKWGNWTAAGVPTSQRIGANAYWQPVGGA